MALKSWPLALALSAALGCAQPHAQRSGGAAGWHACERDDQPAACRPSYLGDGLLISWRDGGSTRLQCATACEPGASFVDEKGARWTHELFIQGNSRYTHSLTGSTLFVPLRASAHPFEP